MGLWGKGTRAVQSVLFETAIGTCGLVWGPAGIAAVALPERAPQATAAHLARRMPHARPADPSPEIKQVIARIQGLMSGKGDDLADIVLDFGQASDFQRAAYGLVRAIPPGETRTYGEVARALGDPMSARAVGEAMGRNPCPILMPCHRVLGADGKVGGFSAPGGAATKLKMLEIEGAISVDRLPLFDR